VRRRTCFAAAAIAAASLAVGVGIATAASKPATPKATPAVTVLKCHGSLTVVPPAGSASVDQPPSVGSQYGQLRCPTAMFGRGVESSTFKVPDTGDMVGKYTQYFGDGTVHGTFDLTPQEASGTFTSGSFTSQNWEGTLKVTGGTGAFKLIKELKGKKGIGTMTCTSPDSVHMTCHEKVKLTAI
jgi:hypothetical protein